MIVLQGGGPFVANDDLDRDIVARHEVEVVAVLPTADAMETPAALVDAARDWAERLGGLTIEPVMVLQRADATVDAAAAIDVADAVWVVGDSSLHLRSVIKSTPVCEALAAKAAGGVLAAVGASAAALCDPMTDPRGGAFTLGLGLVENLALVTDAETWPSEQLQRSRDLVVADHPDACLAVLPTGAALVNESRQWRTVGDAELVGELRPS